LRTYGIIDSMIEGQHILRILPIHVIHPRLDTEDEILVGEELESLIATFGGKIVARIIQKLDKTNNATFIGKGKIDEVAEKIKEHNVDIVVLNEMAKPKQIHALKEELKKANPQIEVWDRVDLILYIFEKHATTMEAKLQIELARMRYMGPRIYGMGKVLSRQGGGIGTSGVGETNTELMKRHWRAETKRITDQLEKISKNREQQLAQRKRAGFKTVSIVGYTNAGKSSLYNALTGKKGYSKDELFATLDSSIGKLYIPTLSAEVLITDTIGFIRDLPPTLIDAFKSTLMESIHADIILHVIDVSDPEMHTKISVVNAILEDLGRKPEDILFVFNKIDQAQNLNQLAILKEYNSRDGLFVSVKDKIGLEEVLESIAKRLTVYKSPLQIAS
jgi:GTPase